MAGPRRGDEGSCTTSYRLPLPVIALLLICVWLLSRPVDLDDHSFRALTRHWRFVYRAIAACTWMPSPGPSVMQFFCLSVFSARLTVSREHPVICASS